MRWKTCICQHCYKSKETKRKTCTCQHWPIYLSNGQLPSQLSWVQHKSLKNLQHFIPTLAGKYQKYIEAKVGIKYCKNFYIHNNVFYPAMMVTNHQLDRLADAGKCMFFTLFLHFLQKCQHVHVFNLISILFTAVINTYSLF